MAELRAPKNSTKTKKIVGRGRGSTHGGTCGKGTKGQNSRSGGGVRPGFEGGQMPLYRRVARRGFKNYPFKQAFHIVNLSSLEKKFNDGDTVDAASLVSMHLIRNSKLPVKILANGDLTKKLSVKADKVSASAIEKIQKAGGDVVVFSSVPETKENE